MDPEMSSFLFKFQNICRAGKDANLLFTSKNGKTIVNLSVELECLSHPSRQPPFHPQKHRNGPSCERRRQKRAEARKNEAEQALTLLSAEEVDVLAMAEEAVGSTSNAVKVINNELNDEICPDSEYQVKETEDTAEQVVEFIEVKPDSDDGWKNLDVKDLVEYKCKIVGVKVNGIEINRSNSGNILSCYVKIEPTPRKNLDAPGFPFRNWSVKQPHR